MKQCNNRKSQKGFTLIELIVVFSTITFLSTIGIASYVSYSQSQSLQAATQDLVTTIQLAKSRANSQVKPPVCLGQLDGYSVKISFANKAYTLNAVCGGNSFPLQTTKLPNNITFHEDTIPNVFFAVISGAVRGGGIGITGCGVGNCKTKFIEVDSVGIIVQVSGIPTLTPPTPTPTITPTPTPTPTPRPFKYVFVTSTVYDGNLLAAANSLPGQSVSTGLDGGDKICRTLANAVPALNDTTWKAWLSASGVHAKNRIPDAEYRLVDGTTVIANDKIDLTNGDIYKPISKDETAALKVGSIWTGTLSTGLADPIDRCNDWASNSSSVLGHIGLNHTSGTSNWTQTNVLVTCDAPLFIYCFEE